MPGPMLRGQRRWVDIHVGPHLLQPNDNQSITLSNENGGMLSTKRVWEKKIF